MKRVYMLDSREGALDAFEEILRAEGIKVRYDKTTPPELPFDYDVYVIHLRDSERLPEGEIEKLKKTQPDCTIIGIGGAAARSYLTESFDQLHFILQLRTIESALEKSASWK